MSALMDYRIRETIKKHNDSIDNYMNNQLAIDLGYPSGTKEFPMSDWFKAQECIKKQNFYQKAMDILNRYRKMGYDVRISMHDNKLVY